MTRSGERREIGAVAWSIASALLSRGAGLIFTPVFTRILTPSEFGVYSLFTGLSGILTVICTLEISGSAIYKGFAQYDENGADEFTSAVLGAEAFMTLISFIIYSLFRKTINRLLGLGDVLPIILILQIFFTAVAGIYIAKLRYVGKFKEVALLNAFQGLFSPPLALLFIRLGIRATGRIYAQLTVSGIIALMLSVLMIRGSKRIFSGKIWKYIFSLLIPMFPHYIASSTIAQGDKIIVAKRLGESAVGKYSAAFSVGHIPSLITSGIALALTPYMIKRMKNKMGSEAERLARISIWVCTLFILGFMTLLPEVFLFFASRDYYSALPSAYVIAAGVLLSFSVTLSNTALLYYGGAGMITKNTLISAALTIPLAYYLTGRLGYIGSALSSLTAYAIMLILGYLKLSRLAPGKAGFVNSYLLIYGILTVGALFIFMLRPSLFARILLFLAISLALCLEALRVIKLTKKKTV